MTNFKVFLFLFIILLLSFDTSEARTYHGSALAPDGQNGWVVASDTEALVLHTSNGGINWLGQYIPDPRYLFDVFFLTNQKGWIGGHQGFLFYTINYGLLWSRELAGISHKINRIFFIDDSCGWLACNFAIIGRTIHGGIDYQWEQICLAYQFFNIDTVEVYGISFINRNQGWLCAGRMPEWQEGDTWFIKGQGYIAASNDSGKNWQLQKRDTIYDFFDIRFKDILNGIVVGGNDRTMSAVVMRTYDGGNSWQQVNIPSQIKVLRAMDMINNNFIWAVGHNGTIIHSRDGGNNWITQNSNVYTTLYDVDFSDTLNGLVAGDSYVLYTHDGGNTWHTANLGIEEIVSLPLVMKNDIRIVPNPASSVVRVRCPSSVKNINIFDVSGKVVREILRDAQNDNIVRVSLDGIKNGIYFVKVGDEVVKEKLVITK